MSDDRERLAGLARILLDRLDDVDVGEPEASEDDRRFGVPTGEGRVELVVHELFEEEASVRPAREAVAAFWEAIAREAAGAWSADGDRPHVEAWISPGGYQQTTSGVDGAAIGEALARLTEAGLPGPGAMKRFTPSFRRDADFPLLLDSLAVARLETYSRSRWRLAGGAGPDGVGPEAVEEAIARCSGEEGGRADAEGWLLLVADDYRLAGPVPVSGDALDADYQAPFGRVYLLRPLDDALHRLARRRRE